MPARPVYARAETGLPDIGASGEGQIKSPRGSGDADLLAPLRRYWGYDSFRPKQEEIIRSLLGGNDVCAVMPTGGGKSLCYQLPAVVSEKTVVVVSPLIALMQDQAAALGQMGIPAAALNSFLSGDERRAVMARAVAGEYRLLYLSPERLAMENTFDWLARVPVGLFAVDEAHCISEWGHEFRPDYRLLSRLRTRFAAIPIAAFTASATRQVRHDILKQLSMREPHLYIASFHRKNLNYVARECEAHSQMALLGRALRHYMSAIGNVIVYAPTIKRVEETVEYLEEIGIAAIPYHAKLEPAERRENQERWMSDEVRVLVGTIAFGLGINKPSVRAVIHLSLPKSIEQYYQEAGRAGRDGKPADCVLLWQKRDHVLLEYFIGKIDDDGERERAWERKRIVSRFVDAKGCRHRAICLHFGETPKWTKCGACDNCGVRPGWVGTEGRSEKKEVLRLAAQDDKGGRDDKGVKGWDDAGAEGRDSAGGKGLDGERRSQGDGSRRRALRAVRDFLYSGAEDVEVARPDDAELADYLREWRRNAAREKKVAAFVVMHDSTMEELCRRRPSTLAELMRVRGIGEHKLEIYGAGILAALRNFAAGARAAGAAPSREARAAKETLRLLREGRTIEEIARIRGREISTVVETVAGLIEAGRVELDEKWMSPGARPLIEAACRAKGMQSLREIKDAVPAYVSFNDIRLVMAGLKAKASSTKSKPNA